jgi:ABC-2 type transport system ATP-binding protein
VQQEDLMLVKVENLELRLDGNKILKDVSLSVERNQIYGLLGPNGAGKSSTIFVILGLYAAVGGTLELFGDTSARPSADTRRRIGVMPEHAGFYGWMNAPDYLAWYAGLYGGPRQSVPQLLDQVGLSHVGTQPISQFSHGMRQRLALARALIHAPELLILDEPTSGLDPRGRRMIHDLLIQLTEERGVGILLSTHLLEDVDRLCSRIGIIDHGRTVIEGPLTELLNQQQAKQRFRLRIEDPPQDQRALPQGVSLVGREGSWFHFVVDEDRRKRLPSLWEDLLACGWRFTEIHAEGGGLEELYLHLTATAGQNAEGESK